MKSFPLSLILLAVSFLSFAQQIKESEVPADVKTVAYKQTNSQPVTMWVLDKKRGKYIATLVSNTAVKGIEISLDGKWIETTEGVLPTNLPSQVLKAAKDGVPGYELDNFFYITSPGKAAYYTIDASSDDEDLTLTIDPDGKNLKREQR